MHTYMASAPFLKTSSETLETGDCLLGTATHAQMGIYTIYAESPFIALLFASWRLCSQVWYQTVHHCTCTVWGHLTIPVLFLVASYLLSKLISSLPKQRKIIMGERALYSIQYIGFQKYAHL